jgi:hypothetical protein
MRLKPIPLAAYSKDLIPPVTGVGGMLAPVANSYDTSGNFAERPRMGSLSKKRRLDEIDRVFDLSMPYPPPTWPKKQPLDLTEIKTLLVAATAAGEDVSPLLDSPDLDPKIKVFGNLGMALLGLVAAIVENGLVPMTEPTAETAPSPGGPRGESGSRRNGPAPPPKIPTGIKELKECLEKADHESILFDANLGPVPMGNRNGLVNAFSSGLRAAAITTAEGKGQDPAEAVRAMNDALECVSDMDFIGIKSDKAKSRNNNQLPVGNHCTMPIKLRFEDRNTRLHFERTIRENCGLRATMSLPKPIREEQSVFVRALKARYPDEVVTARPDLGSLHFVAFRKKHNEKKWIRCPESIPIPHSILLPDYKVREAIVLPPAVVVSATADGGQEGVAEMELGSQASGSQENSS